MERVQTLDDGRRVMDPWDLFDNWVTACGWDAMMDTDPLAVVRWYGQWVDGERLTGDLFAREASA